MSFNSLQSPYATKLSHTSVESNLITNPSSHYQTNVQKTQTYKTSEYHTSNSNNPSSMNSNYLNVGSKYTQQKQAPLQAQKNLDSWKSSNMMTAKSMIFTGTEKQSSPLFPQKKTFAGLGKLSEMARTATNNFDDSGDFDTNKNPNQSSPYGNSQDQKSLNFKKYGNSLVPESANFKNNFVKDPSVAASMILNQNDQKTNVYKSFINFGSTNNSNSENRKTGGLDFLLKFKKQQEQKKQRELNNGKINQLKVNQIPKNNDNGNRNLLSPSENHHQRIFHQYSAPDLGHVQKNYHHEPIQIHSLSKNEDRSHKVHNQFESPVHNTSPQNAYTYTNLTNKYSQPAQNQPSNQTFMKKFNSDKIDRYIPPKPFNSQSELPSSKQGTSTYPKSFAFSKKQTKTTVQSTSPTGQSSPIKDKFVSPAFFKNRQSKMSSDAKTVETTPSPTSIKSKTYYEIESPTHGKSALSDNGSNGSVEYMDGDLSSEQPKEWSLNDFQMGDKLGKGAFGDVYFAREKHLGFMCVLKKMSKKRIKDLQREQHVIRQLKIQMYLNHKHLTSMYGYFHDKENIYLILEYLPDGNLSQIKKRKKTSQKETADIMKQVCQGLSFMHKHNIIHRDIKPQNIFVNEGYIKLGDFGCSVFTDGMRKTVVSCLQYSSPEQLSGECYNEKIDVWGIGILAYELLTGRSPYEKEIMNMANQNVDFSALKFPEQLKLSELAKDFIMSLLNVDPIDRLNITEALEHRFITTNYQPPAKLQSMV